MDLYEKDGFVGGQNNSEITERVINKEYLLKLRESLENELVALTERLQNVSGIIFATIRDLQSKDVEEQKSEREELAKILEGLLGSQKIINEKMMVIENAITKIDSEGFPDIQTNLIEQEINES